MKYFIFCLIYDKIDITVEGWFNSGRIDLIC